MPRTLPVGLQTAIDNNAEPYFKLWAEDIGETPVLISAAQITEFVIAPLELSVKFYLKASRSPFLNLQIERGRISSGTPITIKTSTFHAYETRINDEIGLFEARAHIAPEQRIAIAGDDTYENVITNFCTEIGKTAVFQDPSAAWLDYQFLPDGRTLTLNNARFFFSFLRQKYLIFATDYGDNKILFSQFRTPADPDWSIEDIRFYMGENSINRRFMWRDEASTIHYSDASENPIHNLGYLESAASAPARASFYEFRTNILHAPELKYLTGDYADVTNGTNIAPDTMLEIVETFNPKQTPAWNIQIKGIPIFTNTEGGALPSTIEAAAPYTPLNTSHFNNVLDETDNNIQAAFETLDDHTHSMSNAAFKEVIQDIIGDLLATQSNDVHTGAQFNYNDADGELQFQIDDEYLKDATGAMVSGNTETGIAVTYQDSDNTFDFEIQAKAETNANDIYRCNNSGASAFVGTIATLPGGATLTYNVTSGQENAMVPAATTQLAKMRLYNTTRGTSALISNCNTGTNTITLTANVPAGWAVTDVITIASQTVSGGGVSWVDLEITSGPTGKSHMFMNIQVVDTTTANEGLRIHPFETFSAAKLAKVLSQVATVTNDNMILVPITSNVFSASWNPTGAASMTITIREAGYLY